MTYSKILFQQYLILLSKKDYTSLSFSGCFSTHILGRYTSTKPMRRENPLLSKELPSTVLITALQSVLCKTNNRENKVNKWITPYYQVANLCMIYITLLKINNVSTNPKLWTVGFTSVTRSHFYPLGSKVHVFSCSAVLDSWQPHWL